jgi:hypothetical protein
MAHGFQGWEPPTPVAEQILESTIMEITHLNFDGGEGAVVTNARFDHNLYPRSRPEQISVVLTEPFAGVDAKICVGRVNRAKEDDFYLAWTKLPGHPTSFQQRPESIFKPPDGSNNIIRLTFRLRGTKIPQSGRILFFIKHRLI